MKNFISSFLEVGVGMFGNALYEMQPISTVTSNVRNITERDESTNHSTVTSNVRNSMGRRVTVRDGSSFAMSLRSTTLSDVCHMLPLVGSWVGHLVLAASISARVMVAVSDISSTDVTLRPGCVCASGWMGGRWMERQDVR